MANEKEPERFALNLVTNRQRGKRRGFRGLDRSLGMPITSFRSCKAGPFSVTSSWLLLSINRGVLVTYRLYFNIQQVY